MKSTTSKLGIGIIALAMLGGVNGCAKYNVCNQKDDTCSQYNLKEFKNKFAFNPTESSQMLNADKHCVVNPEYCEEFTKKHIEVIVKYGDVNHTAVGDNYVICFGELETNCRLIGGRLINSIQTKYRYANEKKEETKTIQNTPITPTGNPDVAHESKKLEEKVKETKSTKRIKREFNTIWCDGIKYDLTKKIVQDLNFDKKSPAQICSEVTEKERVKEPEKTVEEKKKVNKTNKTKSLQLEVTIKKVEYESLSFCMAKYTSDIANCGTLPVKYIFATDNMDSYIFIYINAGPVKKGIANIKYQNLFENQIRVDSLFRKIINNPAYKPHFPAQEISADGIIEKIEYKL
ncbi:hypothetical protein HOK51_04260 [Candidatus Woesearchaeota archaeon]|jgi:hypothetical protein|nr:hypothetical protein [Candidatus Woesearchaeota archaeon]MBT6519036.1 hypothetical protein [Candidatus Woesearchaeota archaeon]MBT7368765.1 hypothetical protein [Candidatus Woesearchaeota archaeon]